MAFKDPSMFRTAGDDGRTRQGQAAARSAMPWMAAVATRDRGRHLCQGRRSVHVRMRGAQAAV